MSMELTGTPQSTLKLGYNKDGDETFLQINDTIQVNQNTIEFQGQVYLVRGSYKYYLTTNDKVSCLMNTMKGEEFKITLSLMPKN